MNGYRAKLAKRKGAWDEVHRKPDASFQESCPCEITQDALNFSHNEL